MNYQEIATRFLDRCRTCQHGTPSGRCQNPATGFREYRPQTLNYAAQRATGGLPTSYRRVQLALLEPCPGFQERLSTN